MLFWSIFSLALDRVGSAMSCLNKEYLHFFFFQGLTPSALCGSSPGTQAPIYSSHSLLALGPGA